MQFADILFVNANIITQDDDCPTASQIALSKHTILAVGDNLSSTINEDTKIVDLDGDVIIPGFIDAHLHFLWGGEGLLTIPAHKARSKQEFIDLVAEYAQGKPSGAWLKGGGWNEHLLDEKCLPHRQWLDQAAPNQPIFLTRHDGHSAVASTKALQIAGISKDTPDPEGGLIDRDEQGEPTGILRDMAMDLLMAVIPEDSESELEAKFEAAQKYLLDQGVTAVGDMIYDMQHFHFFQKKAREGKLKIRIMAYLPLLKWPEIQKIVESGIYEDEWFQVKGLKGFCDGSLGSHTARMLEPYEDTPDSSGLYDKDWSDVELVREIMIEADNKNYQLVIHAIGDKANRDVLDVFQSVIEANGKRDRRFRIEHAQHIHPEDQGRFSELDVIASIQPAHCIDDSLYAEKLLGKRCSYAYPFNSLQKSGAKLAFGSDWPVSPADPIATISAAIHRNAWYTEEAIDFKSALKAHTVDAAYAVNREDIGRLKAGCLADLVILGSEFLDLKSFDKQTGGLIQSVYVNGVKFEA